MHSLHKQPLDLQFEHLRTFLALADSGSFSRTGDQIGLSQSAVSRHIRALESALGLRLFERMGRRAVLTSAGNVLRTRLEKGYAENSGLVRASRLPTRFFPCCSDDTGVSFQRSRSPCVRVARRKLLKGCDVAILTSVSLVRTLFLRTWPS